MRYTPALGALLASAALALPALSACAPPESSLNRPTAATILEITPAPTQNIDATATMYASKLIPTPTPAGLYIVQQNDTLGGIAGEFGSTVEELLAANGLTDADALQVGQALLIPSLISQTLVLGTPVADATAEAAPAAPATPAQTLTPTPTFTSP
ncbi:LysM peptidoglycan-binding domain-containing protein [Chloroflexia bacterium SDU3-3]|nr:LysM peptidoglycan-binding domain-containing protein [Chloroflexia bacterium SDU3-3]